jgi:hypothetical protein
MRMGLSTRQCDPKLRLEGKRVLSVNFPISKRIFGSLLTDIIGHDIKPVYPRLQLDNIETLKVPLEVLELVNY